ncbi:hypothetical protein ACLBXM_19525 [Xanthobacteraceae bacterium A53D]
MLSSLFASVPLDLLLTRMVTTALVVIGISLAVRKLGPVIGGSLAGLPVVLGPGFFFLMRSTPEAFVPDAAAYALLSLCGTQAFVLAYISLARRAGPFLSLAAAITAWGSSAALLRLLPPKPLLAIGLFVMVTAAAWFIARGIERPAIGPIAAERPAQTILRGCLAGALVAMVSVAAGQLGTVISGLLVAYPMGYTVLSVTIHRRNGADVAVAMLHAAILGISSIAGFSATIALTARTLGPLPAFLVGLVVSLVITIAIVLGPRLWRARLV